MTTTDSQPSSETAGGHPHATQPHGSPATAGATAAPGAYAHGQGPAFGKQFVKFSFYRVRDEVRRAPAADRAALGEDLTSLLARSAERMLTRTYSTVGTRADTDFLVWQVSDELPEIQGWQGSLLRSSLGGALERSHSFLSMTMRSMYVNPLHPESKGRERLREDGGTSDYLFVYPMVKSKAWYKLPMEERQAMMNEHIEVGHKYHAIKINTTYSYGLDDQEFVVAFEGDNPGEFLALVRELRTSRSTSYTERDTPMFTCRRVAAEALAGEIGLTL